MSRKAASGSETAIDPDAAGWTEAVRRGIQHYIDTHHGFLSWLGVAVEAMDSGRVVLRVPYDEKLTNTQFGAEDEGRHDPPIQGGVAATLVDTAGGIAFRPAMPDPVNDGIATISLDMHYLEPASTDLVATAEVLRHGGTIGVSEVLVESETADGERTPVATGTGAYRLFTDS